jgi:peptidoglycan/LPS O-acetylase OafA/YrhL
MNHQTKKEWLNERNILGKILYWLGVIRLVEKDAAFNNKYLYGSRLRRIHPITWICFIGTLIMYGINTETIHQFKKDSVWLSEEAKVAFLFLTYGTCIAGVVGILTWVMLNG